MKNVFLIVFMRNDRPFLKFSRSHFWSCNPTKYSKLVFVKKSLRQETFHREIPKFQRVRVKNKITLAFWIQLDKNVVLLPKVLVAITWEWKVQLLCKKFQVDSVCRTHWRKWVAWAWRCLKNIKDLINQQFTSILWFIFTN